MASAFTNYNQTVFLNRVKLQGVSSVSASYNVKTKPVNILGQGCVNQVISDIPESTVSITRDLNFVDVLQPYTGLNRALRGSIHYDNRILGFDEAHLTSYSYSVQYGQTPVSTADISVFGDIGYGLQNEAAENSLNASGQYVERQVKVPRPSDISLTCLESTSNRITNFSFDVSVPKIPVYAINNTRPVQVSFGWPLVINTSFTMEVDDFTSKRMFSYLTDSAFDSFSINVKGIIYDANFLTEVDGDELTMPDGTFLTLLSDDTYQVSQLWNFNSSNTRLISQDFSASADDVTQVRLNYQTYIGKNRGGVSGPMLRP